jgi:F0F1-type ATP synthase assembly protein I
MGLRRPRPATAWGRAFEVAFEAGLAVVLGVAIGVWLDDRYDTSPLFLFVFTAIGFGASVKRLLSLQPPKGEEEKPGPSGGDDHA